MRRLRGKAGEDRQTGPNFAYSPPHMPTFQMKPWALLVCDAFRWEIIHKKGLQEAGLSM